MNVEIGAEAAQFPEKEYINGIDVAVQCGMQYFEVKGRPITRGMQYCEICSWQITVWDAAIGDKLSPVSLLPAIKISCQNPLKPYFAFELYSMFF